MKRNGTVSLESLVSTYGYAALLIGTFFEGETILIIGGFFARLGYLKLLLVIIASFTGTLISDQLFFFLGRMKGQKFLLRRPAWQSRLETIHKYMESHKNLVILGFRFMYGFRTITPFVIGMSNIKAKYFIILNVIGALVWAIVIGTGGYLFGLTLEKVIGNIRHYEQEVLLIIAGAGAFIWIFHFYRRRKLKE
jgi:membrane protein DedA with SNARE-associated domain